MQSPCCPQPAGVVILLGTPPPRVSHPLLCLPQGLLGVGGGTGTPACLYLDPTWPSQLSAHTLAPGFGVSLLTQASPT